MNWASKFLKTPKLQIQELKNTLLNCLIALSELFYIFNILMFKSKNL